MSRYNTNRPPREIKLHHGDIIEEALAVLRSITEDGSQHTVDEIEVLTGVANSFVGVAQEVRQWVSRERVRPREFDREFPRSDEFPGQEELPFDEAV